MIMCFNPLRSPALVMRSLFVHLERLLSTKRDRSFLLQFNIDPRREIRTLLFLLLSL